MRKTLVRGETSCRRDKAQDVGLIVMVMEMVMREKIMK